MPKKIEFEGAVHEFPDDFTDDDIASALGSSIKSQKPTAASLTPTPGETPEQAKSRRDQYYKENPETIGSVAKGLAKSALGIGEGILNQVTGGVVAPAARLTARAIGMNYWDRESEDQFQKRQAAHPELALHRQTPEEYIQQTGEDVTYTPRLKEGKLAAEIPGNVVEAAVKPLNKAARKVIGTEPMNALDEFAASPSGRVIQDVVGVAGAAIPAKGAFAPKKPGMHDFPKGDVTTKISETPKESLRAAGFKFREVDRPLDKPSKTKKFVEKAAGSKELASDFNTHNQQLATRLAAKDMGMGDKVTAITPTMFEKAAAPHIAKYGEVGDAVGKFSPSPEFSSSLDAITKKVGIDPDIKPALDKIVDTYRYAEMSGPDAVKTVSALRRRAAKERKSQDVNTQDRGDVRQAVADAIENEIGKQLEASGNTQLLGEWQQARTMLAKINEGETATTAGQVDPHLYKRLKDRGAPLSGAAAILADAAEHIPEVTKHIQKVADTSPGAEAATFTGLVTEGPRAAIRRVLGGDTYQNTRGTPAKALGPNAALSDYFPVPEAPPPATPKGIDLPPTPAGSMLRANQLAGDLELVPDPVVNAERFPPAPSRMQAETPPMQRGDISFTPSQPRGVDLAGELGLLTEAPNSGLQFRGSNPRAAGLAGDLGLVEDVPFRAGKPDLASELQLVPWDAEASPGGPFEFTKGVPYRDPGAAAPGTSFDAMREAGQYNQTPVGPRQDYLSIDPELQALADKLGIEPNFNPVKNNASGESAASLEAISRRAQEKAAGQTRELVDPEGNGYELNQASDVDAVAPKGHLVIQKGVGKGQYTILDRGGMSKRHAEGLLARFIARRNGELNE